MISKKYIQELLSETAFKRDYTKTEEDLFNYIIESKYNGNYSQVREFVKRLSQKQHSDFLIFLQRDNNFVDSIKQCQECKEIDRVFLK
jgi:hypothetical protein